MQVLRDMGTSLYKLQLVPAVTVTFTSTSLTPRQVSVWMGAAQCWRA